jgi:hypothetical protein
LGSANLQPHGFPDEQWLVYSADDDLMKRRIFPTSQHAMQQATREHDYEMARARKLIAKYGLPQ